MDSSLILSKISTFASTAIPTVKIIPAIPGSVNVASNSVNIPTNKIRFYFKDGVKFNLSKDILNLSVNNTNSGDGKESLNVKFDHDLEISFNSRYLIDIAAQLEGEKIEIFFNDSGSPALIKDPVDLDSIFVVMPMKG